MALSITQIRSLLNAGLVSAAASIGVTINPNNWVFVPGNLSMTDYKILMREMVASGMAFIGQLMDALTADIEARLLQIPPQTEAWFQYQMLSVFQFNIAVPQLPQIGSTSSLVPSFNPIVLSYQVIKFCSVRYGSAGRCLISVAADNGSGLPGDLDTYAGTGALAAAISFVNECSAPGISYLVTSGKSDWLFLQIDLYYQGSYQSVIFHNVSNAINTFLNTLSTTAFNNNANATLKLSFLEDAILKVAGVTDVVFINVQARPDSISFGDGTNLVVGSLEVQRNYQTVAGYLTAENNTSTDGVVPNSRLSDPRIGLTGDLNLKCIASNS